jgi:hypothetical protein
VAIRAEIHHLFGFQFTLGNQSFDSAGLLLEHGMAGIAGL